MNSALCTSTYAEEGLYAFASVFNVNTCSCDTVLRSGATSASLESCLAPCGGAGVGGAGGGVRWRWKPGGYAVVYKRVVEVSIVSGDDDVPGLNSAAEWDLEYCFDDDDDK